MKIREKKLSLYAVIIVLCFNEYSTDDIMDYWGETEEGFKILLGVYNTFDRMFQRCRRENAKQLSKLNTDLEQENEKKKTSLPKQIPFFEFVERREIFKNGEPVPPVQHLQSSQSLTYEIFCINIRKDKWNDESLETLIAIMVTKYMAATYAILFAEGSVMADKDTTDEIDEPINDITADDCKTLARYLGLFVVQASPDNSYINKLETKYQNDGEIRHNLQYIKLYFQLMQKTIDSEILLSYDIDLHLTNVKDMANEKIRPAIRDVDREFKHVVNPIFGFLLFGHSRISEINEKNKENNDNSKISETGGKSNRSFSLLKNSKIRSKSFEKHKPFIKSRLWYKAGELKKLIKSEKEPVSSSWSSVRLSFMKGKYASSVIHILEQIAILIVTTGLEENVAANKISALMKNRFNRAALKLTVSQNSEGHHGLRILLKNFSQSS